MSNPKPLCIYHANCADGFGAAWVVRKFFGDGNVDFHAGVYQEPPPDVKNRDVIIVDFSFKIDVMRQVIDDAHSVIVLDHHKSAAKDLASLPTARKDWPEHVGFAGAPSCPHYGVIFDMERSGAMIAWNYFFPYDPAPWLIKHIQDRDLWRFKLRGTREIQALLFSYPYDFDVWDELARQADDKSDWIFLYEQGRAIERKHHKDVAELVKVTQRVLLIGGHYVQAASLPYTYSSDAGHLMAEGQPFAACYWDTPKGRTFSLRSADDGLDVSEIAKKYGGGGHARAAGFSVPFGRLWEFEP